MLVRHFTIFARGCDVAKLAESITWCALHLTVHVGNDENPPYVKGSFGWPCKVLYESYQLLKGATQGSQ